VGKKGGERGGRDEEDPPNKKRSRAEKKKAVRKKTIEGKCRKVGEKKDHPLGEERTFASVEKGVGWVRGNCKAFPPAQGGGGERLLGA